MITYLNVPFGQRHAAKKLGALWNPARKQWYVIDTEDMRAFSSWISSHLNEPHKETPYETEFRERQEKNLTKKELRRKAKKKNEN